jgi:hypothetical protein
VPARHRFILGHLLTTNGPDTRCCPCCPCWPFVGPRMDPMRAAVVRVGHVRVGHSTYCNGYGTTTPSHRNAVLVLYCTVLELYCTGTVPPHHLVTTLSVLPYLVTPTLPVMPYRSDWLLFFNNQPSCSTRSYYSFGVHVVPSPLQHNVGKVV